MDIKIIISQMIQLFLIIAIGFGLGKTKLFCRSFTDKLTEFVLNITMPCMILASVMSSSQGSQLALQDILISTFLLVLILPIFSYICTRLFRENRNLYMFMMMYPNVGFIGFPLMLAIFGEKSILSTAIINMAFNLSLFSLGIITMSNGSDQKTIFNLKKLINPGIVFSVIAIVIYIVHIKIPVTIVQPITLIGNMTTPLAMLIIGATLSSYEIKNIFNDYKVYVFTLFIDIIVPILFSPLINICIKDAMIKGITIIILAMPVANGAVLFAKNYQQDEFLAAKTVFISTLLSIATIPLVVYLLLI